MVGEDEDLRAMREVGERAQPGGGTIVRELHEEVVGDERQRRGAVQMEVGGGEPQRPIGWWRWRARERG